MHEVTETWEIDGKWHVRPSVGKNKGKTLKVFDTEEEANKWAKKRSDNYKPKKQKKGFLEKQGLYNGNK